MGTSPKLEDPGLFTTPVVRHQHPEAPTIEHKEALEIVLYGPSSEIKWKFLQQLIDKAAVTSGHVLADDLCESIQAQSLSLVRPSGSHTPFFDVIHVSDRTTECAQLETVSIIATGLSSHFHTTFLSLLGRFRLPSATFLSHCLFTQLPSSPSYLGTLLISLSLSPSVGITDHEFAVQAAEDDWDLLFGSFQPYTESWVQSITHCRFRRARRISILLVYTRHCAASATIVRRLLLLKRLRSK